MTEKRFNDAKGYVYDGKKCIGIIVDDYTCENIINLLNTFHDENEDLKKHILEVEKDNERLEEITSQFKVGDIVNLKSANEVIDDQRREIKLLKKENGQLKEEIKDLNDVLARYEEKESELHNRWEKKIWESL